MRDFRFVAMTLALGAIGVGLTIHDAFALLPWDGWLRLLEIAPASPPEVSAIHAFAPRIAVALLAGAALSIAGCLLQQALRNPLADPATVGASAGAGFALAVATLFAPGMLYAGREAVASVGALVATAAVLGVAARDRFSPVTLILAGLIVTLTAGAATSLVLTLSTDYVGELFVWQSGSLMQNGDAGARALAARVAVAAILAALLVRPLTLLDLDDAAASALGLSPMAVRVMALGVAIALTGRSRPMLA